MRMPECRLYRSPVIGADGIRAAVAAVDPAWRVESTALLGGGAVNINVLVGLRNASVSRVVVRFAERKRRIGREAALLRRIRESTEVHVPEVLFVDESCAVVSREYMVMEYVDGESMDSRLESAGTHAADVRCVAEALGRGLASIHAMETRVPPESGPGPAPGPRAVDLYRRTLGDRMGDRLVEALSAAREAGVGRRADVRLHGDVRGSNVLVARDPRAARVTLIDFERSSLGDATSDFASADIMIWEDCPGAREWFYGGAGMPAPGADEMRNAYVSFYAGLVPFAWGVGSRALTLTVRRRLESLLGA